MSTALLTKLSDKIRLSLQEIHRLKKDNERLTAELALTQDENKRARRLLRQHEDLLKERDLVRGKVQKTLAKLEKLKL